MVQVLSIMECSDVFFTVSHFVEDLDILILFQVIIPRTLNGGISWVLFLKYLPFYYNTRKVFKEKLCCLTNFLISEQLRISAIFSSFLRSSRKVEKIRGRFLKFSACILIVFGMITLSSSNAQIISQNAVLEEKNLQDIQYEPHAPISINNNTDFAVQAQNEGWIGDGSQEDPYLIKGLEIETSGPSITIINTDVYFQISDNLLKGTSWRSTIDNMAISLNNVKHGTIASNIFQDVSECIRIRNSANITISKNTLKSLDVALLFKTMYIYRSLNINISGNTVNTVFFESSHNNSISYNEFVGTKSGYYALYLLASSNNLVSNNIIHDYGYGPGISLQGKSSNNIIVDNVLTNVNYGYVQDSGLANVITNNTFTSKWDGITYRGSHGIISHNRITSTDRDGISLGRRGFQIGSAWNLLAEFEDATNTTVTENIIANSLGGIFLEDSQEATIMNNTIYSNRLYGLKFNSSSTNNTVKWNDFLDNNRPHSSLISLTPSTLTAQAFDAGSENTFTANYWFEWTSPDSDRNGIVDAPYFIDGEAQNTDTSPSASPNNPKNSPAIIAPLTNLPGVVIAMMVFITLITLVMVKSFNREAPEKTIIYLFIVFVLGSLGVVGVNLLRNFNDLINPLFFRPPDIFVLTYGLTVILGGFCTYRLVLYYRETHSSQYILLTGFIFGTAVTMFLWQLWVDYLSRAAVDYSLGLFSLFEPEIMVGQANFFLGMIALLIFAVRLRPWKEYHILLKSLIILLGYEIICGGLLYWPFGRTLQWLNILPIGYFNDPQFLFNQLSIVYNLNQLKILPAPLSHLSSFQLVVFLINVFVAFAFLTAKTVVKTQKIRISRVFWVIFGLSNILLESISLFNVANVLGLSDPFVWFALLSVKQTILLAGLTILLVTAPEALLITRAQIFQARKLYQKLEKGDLGPKMPEDPRFHLLDYKNRFKAYVDSLPSELKEELKIRN